PVVSLIVFSSPTLSCLSFTPPAHHDLSPLSLHDALPIYHLGEHSGDDLLGVTVEHVLVEGFFVAPVGFDVLGGGCLPAVARRDGGGVDESFLKAEGERATGGLRTGHPDDDAALAAAGPPGLGHDDHRARCGRRGACTHRTEHDRADPTESS